MDLYHYIVDLVIIESGSILGWPNAIVGCILALISLFPLELNISYTRSCYSRWLRPSRPLSISLSCHHLTLLPSLLLTLVYTLNPCYLICIPQQYCQGSLVQALSRHEYLYVARGGPHQEGRPALGGAARELRENTTHSDVSILSIVNRLCAHEPEL